MKTTANLIKRPGKSYLINQINNTILSLTYSKHCMFAKELFNNKSEKHYHQPINKVGEQSKVKCEIFITFWRT